MSVVDRARARRLLHDRRSTGRGLSRDDEVRLARLVLDGRWAERHRPVFTDRVADGREAARLLELHCLGVVVQVARQYRGRGVDIEDLVQEGWFGVRRAVELWDYRRGFRLNTYAAWWARQAVQRAIARHGRAIRIPRSAAGKVPEVAVVPLDLATVDVTAGDAYDHVEQQELAAAVRHALAGLNDREREVVQRRFGFRSDDLETLECIGHDIGLTRERIRQIESTALQKLRRNRDLLNSAT